MRQKLRHEVVHHVLQAEVSLQGGEHVVDVIPPVHHQTGLDRLHILGSIIRKILLKYVGILVGAHVQPLDLGDQAHTQ